MIKLARPANALAGLGLVALLSALSHSTLAQDVTVTNTPAQPVHNQPQSDTWPVILTERQLFPDKEWSLTFEFNPVVPEGYRFIVDYVSVHGVEGAGKRLWATFQSCVGVKPAYWGFIAVPLSTLGVAPGGDMWSGGNVAMQTYLDPGCNAIVKVWRESPGSYGTVIVTVQGHMARMSRVEPPPIPRD